MKKLMFPHALLLLALLPSGCALDAEDANVQHRTQAGTWTDINIIDVRFTFDGTLRMAPPNDSCAAPSVLFEVTSSRCAPDGKFTADCDLCCDPSIDVTNCQGYKNAEEYASSQLDQASSLQTTPYTLAATSAILIDFANFYIRTSPSKGYTATDRERLCGAYNKASVHYSRSADLAGPLKPLLFKVSTSTASNELAIRNALLGPRHSLLLLERACQDASAK